MVNENEVYAPIQSVVTSDGTAYAIAPSTPANAPSNAIVTKDYMETFISTNPSLQAPFDRIVEIDNGISCGVDDLVAYVSAGSKVYFPDGINENGRFKFGSVTITDKLTMSTTEAEIGYVSYVCVEFDSNKQPKGLIAIQPRETSSNYSSDSISAYYQYQEDTNFINSSSGSYKYSRYSLPLMLILGLGYGSGSATGVRLLEVFDTYSFFGTSVFKLPSVKYAYANGIDQTTKQPVSDIIESSAAGETLGSSDISTALNNECLLFVRPYGFSSILKPEKFYTGVSEPYGVDKKSIWFDTVNKLYKSNYTSSQVWEQFQTYNLGRITISENSTTITKYISNIKINRDGLIGAKTTPSIVETYHAGTSWYRIWSDGWIEQGDRFYNNANVENTISFLTPFSDTNYTLVINHGVSGGYNSTVAGKHADEAYDYATTSFKAWTFDAVGGNYITWYACGY